MSKADDRRAAQAARDSEQDTLMQQRPVESPIAPTPDRRAWSSLCAGWRGQVHEKDRINADGTYVCRWCWQTLNPPTPEDIANNRQRMVSVDMPSRNPVRRRHW